MSDAPAWVQYLTIGIALLGAVLGIMNTWNAISQRRVRLRVMPAQATALPSQEEMFSIEIVNLSSFAVTVGDVGFSLGGRKVDRGSRLMIPIPIIIDGKPWPRRLEAHESVSVYFDPAEVIAHHADIRKAYARTACGTVAYGTSPALVQLRLRAL